MSDPALDLDSLWNGAVFELDRELTVARDLLAAQKLIVCLAGPVGSGRAALLPALRHGSAPAPSAAGAQAPAAAPPPDDPAELVFWSEPDRPEVRFALPPSYQDIEADKRALAERFVREEADVVLLVLNANAGVTRHDRVALDALRETGKPFLVLLSKLHSLRPADRPLVLDDARDRLGLADAPPIGVSATTGEGMGALVDRLAALLGTRGKEILLDRWRDAREGEAERLIAETMTSAASADGGALAEVVARCARVAVRLGCLAGRDARLGRFREVLREACASPRARGLARPMDPGDGAGAEARIVVEALAFAILQTARTLFFEDGEPDGERLREIFLGRLLEHRLRRALARTGGGTDAGKTLELFSAGMRAGELAPERVSRILPRVKELYGDWRAGRIAEAEYVDRVGALVHGGRPAGSEPPAPALDSEAPSPGSTASPAPALAAGGGAVAEPPKPSLGKRAGRLLEGVAGDVVESLWLARLKPRLEVWTEEQKALLAVDLLKLRAELEVDIDRKYGDLLKKTRQEAEDFMKRAVDTINAQAEDAERRARQRLWISSLFILGWAVLGLLYAILRRVFGA
ncbi:MAG: hypothetical protein HYZ53_15195 [Planctomycetes bacterium]|nr:hypothetical protein [Planctomycetota bacterium]